MGGTSPGWSPETGPFSSISSCPVSARGLTSRAGSARLTFRAFVEDISGLRSQAELACVRWTSRSCTPSMATPSIRRPPARARASPSDIAINPSRC